MPVRTFPTEVLSKRDMVSLDYDGIRLVYPNTTFGPGFGHAMETNPKTSESDDAFYKNILSDIGKSPFSIIKRLPLEEKKKVIEYYQVQCTPYGTEHHKEEYEEILETHDLHENIEKTLYDKHARPIQAVVDPDMPHTSFTVTEKMLRDWQRVHDTYFKDTPECRKALKDIIDSIKQTNGVVDFVILTYKKLHEKSPGSQGEKDFVHMMANNIKIVHYILRAFLSYVGIIKDNKITDVSLSIANYLQDCSKNVQDEIDLYKNMNITLHCVNLMKVIMVMISKRYRQIFIITNSDICTFVETYKDLFVKMFTKQDVDSSNYTRTVNHMDHMINIEVMCHLIHKLDQRYKFVAYNNLQSTYVDTGIKKKQLTKKLRKLHDNPEFNTHDPSNQQMMVKLQQDIANCDQTLQHCEFSIQRAKAEGINNKIRGIKLLYRSNFRDTMSSTFFDCLRSYKEAFEDYKDFNTTSSTTQSKALSNSQMTMGKSFVDGTSNKILFAYENKVFDLNIQKIGKKMMEKYLQLGYETKVYFMTEVIKLFKNNENKTAFMKKYTGFKDGEYSAFEDISEQDTDEYLLELENVLSRPDEFISYVTSSEDNTPLTDFKKDLQAWLSDENYKSMLNILKRCMSINRLLVQCLRPITRIDLNDVKYEDKELYVVCISHLKEGYSGLEESANFFMKRLCYTIKYVFFGRIFDPTHSFPDDEDAIKPLKTLKKKFPKFDVDTFLEGLHLYGFEPQKEYPENYQGGDREFKLYIAIEKRHDLMLFFYIMYSKTLSNHTFQDDRMGDTYFLRGPKQGDGDHDKEDIFYTVGEKTTKDQIQIDLVATEIRQVQGTTPCRRLVPQKVKAKALSYQGFRLLHMCMKSFYVFLQNYYTLPTMGQGVSANEISLWKKQAKYTSMFLIDLANDCIQTNSQTLFLSVNEINWNQFVRVTNHILHIVKSFSDGLERIDYSKVRANSNSMSRLQPMIYSTYRAIASHYYPSIFNTELPDVHYLQICNALERENLDLKTSKNLLRVDVVNDTVKVCTSRTMPDYYNDCMKFVLKHF